MNHRSLESTASTTTSRWRKVSIDDVAKFVFDGPFGSNLKSDDYSTFGPSVVRLENIGFLKFNSDKETFISEEKFAQLARHILVAGDVLVSSFLADEVRVCQLPPELSGAAINKADCFCVRVDPEVCSGEFLKYRLACRSTFVVLKERVHGATRPRINLKQLRAFGFDLPPLDEQERIVEKLDALLARVDACRERLDRVPGILMAFRKSVLAAAVCGLLTDDWRAEREPKLGEALPGTWLVSTIKDVGRLQLGRQRSPKYHSGRDMRPYLRVQNVFENRLDLSDVMKMDFPGQDAERYELKVGDILLNEGQSPQFLGRPAMYKGELPGACFTNTLIRFQASERVLPAFALLVFRHQMHSGRYVSEGTITTNIAHLGIGRFGEVEFPLPPLLEQAEIVRRAEALLGYADGVAKQVKSASSRADGLKPSFLAKAFRGGLVPAGA